MNSKRIGAIIGICILLLFVYTGVRINLFKAESLTSFILAVVGAISIILTGIVFKNNKQEKIVIKKISPRYLRKLKFEAQIGNNNKE